MLRKVRNISRAIAMWRVHDSEAEIQQCLCAFSALSPAQAGTTDANVRRQMFASTLTSRWLCILRFSFYDSWFRLCRVRKTVCLPFLSVLAVLFGKSGGNEGKCAVRGRRRGIPVRSIAELLFRNVALTIGHNFHHA